MTHPPMDDDPLAARLRAALHSEADMVNPSDDGLSRIRAGVGHSRPWWRHPAALAVAAAVVLGLLIGGGAALLGGDNDDPTVVAGPTSSSPSTSDEAPTESPLPSESTPPDVSEPRGFYIYYVRDDDKQLRLYREKHSGGASTQDGVVPAALAEMFETPPTDPDYTSAWPADTTVLDYSVSGDVATVDLSDFVSTGSAGESASVQQLVYTVTANDNAVRQVRLLVDGKAPPSGHNDWSQPTARAPMADVQGLIWLLTPTEGQIVSSPVAITGYGTAFEGTISWEVREDGADGAKVAEGFTSGGSNGEFAEFSDKVDLEPGTYELRAFESSAKDGSPIHIDSKTFTVR